MIAASLGSVLAAGTSLAACGSSPTAASHHPPASATAGFPIATSSGAGSTTWAAVPMGDVGSTRDTFWQVFVDRSGTGVLRLATPAGVADNGGVVVSEGPGAASGHLEVGFFTSQLLGFSPVATSDDHGRHWAGAVLPHALTPVPDALAAGGAGPATALFGRDGATVADGPFSSGRWSTLTTLADLRREAPTSCKLGALTAVVHTGSPRTVAVVGGACGAGGDVALFMERPGGWRYVGTGRASASSSTAVLAAWPAPHVSGEVLALVLVRTRTSSYLEAVRAGGSLSSAESLTTFSLRSGQSVRAIGEAPGGGAVVLVGSGPAGAPTHESVAVLDPTAGAWHGLPAPPPSTEDVLEERGGRVEALVVHRSELVVSSYDLRSPAKGWTPTEVTRVSIPYGSSG